MTKVKITLLAATLASGLALAGAASAAPTATTPLVAPTNIEQAQVHPKSVRRAKPRRHIRQHRRYYAPHYGYYGPGPYGYPYGYGPGLWLGAPGFGFGFGW